MANHKEIEELRTKSFEAAKKRFEKVNEKSQDIIEEYIIEGYQKTLANLIVYLGAEKSKSVMEKLPEPVKNGIEKYLAEEKDAGKSSTRTAPEVMIDAGYVFFKAGWYGVNW